MYLHGVYVLLKLTMSHLSGQTHQGCILLYHFLLDKTGEWTSLSLNLLVCGMGLITKSTS